MEREGHTYMVGEGRCRAVAPRTFTAGPTYTTLVSCCSISRAKGEGETHIHYMVGVGREQQGIGVTHLFRGPGVHHFSFVQQHQVIKHGPDGGAWLVDGGDHCLA